MHGNDEVDDNWDTLVRLLNTKSSSVCVSGSKVELNSLACFHHGVERQVAQT